MEGFEAIQQADQSEGEAYSVTISDRDMICRTNRKAPLTRLQQHTKLMAYNQGLG